MHQTIFFIFNIRSSSLNGFCSVCYKTETGTACNENKPIEEKSTKLINKFYKVLDGRIKIIGCGGVDSGKSAYEKFLAGANYVQLYTGMVFRGPNIVNMIKKELKELLIVDGVKNFAEIIGKK